MIMLTAILAYSQYCNPGQGARKGHPAQSYMTMPIEVDQ